jgi:hypothetical protein
LRQQFSFKICRSFGFTPTQNLFTHLLRVLPVRAL